MGYKGNHKLEKRYESYELNSGEKFYLDERLNHRFYYKHQYLKVLGTLLIILNQSFKTDSKITQKEEG